MHNKKLRVDEEITAKEVLLIDHEKNNLGIISIEQALALAEKADLNLIEVAPLEKPPVCQLGNAYSFKRKKVLQQKKQKRTKLKEIKLRPATEKNDYEVKLRHLIGFLKEGNRVKISMRFKGREIEHKEIGIGLLNKLEKEIKDYGIVEVPIKPDEGRQVVMSIVPKKSIASK